MHKETVSMIGGRNWVIIILLGLAGQIAWNVALRYDLELTWSLGFNMTRKHIKVEPAHWYYHCDQLG